MTRQPGLLAPSFLVVILSALAACQSPRAVDIMTMEPVCDTVPPLVGRDARLPALAPQRSTGGIVGTVTERLTGLAIASAEARLLNPSTRTVVAGPVTSDAHGGFTMSRVPHGRYRLVVRSIGHDASEREVQILLGAVDTAAVALRYRSCSGY